MGKDLTKTNPERVKELSLAVADAFEELGARSALTAKKVTEIAIAGEGLEAIPEVTARGYGAEEIWRRAHGFSDYWETFEKARSLPMGSTREALPNEFREIAERKAYREVERLLDSGLLAKELAVYASAASGARFEAGWVRTRFPETMLSRKWKDVTGDPAVKEYLNRLCSAKGKPAEAKSSTNEDSLIGPWRTYSHKRTCASEFPGLVALVEANGPVQAFASSIQAPPQTVQSWIEGGSIPGEKLIKRICKTYNVSPKYLRSQRPGKPPILENSSKKKEVTYVMPTGSEPKTPSPAEPLPSAPALINEDVPSSHFEQVSYDPPVPVQIHISSELLGKIREDAIKTRSGIVETITRRLREHYEKSEETDERVMALEKQVAELTEKLDAANSWAEAVRKAVGA